MRELGENVQELVERKGWIGEEQKKDMFERIEDVKKWVDEVVDKQKQVALNEDPVFTVGEIEVKLTRLN